MKISVRPAVISEQSLEALDEYRGFRHIVRHVYTFNFDPVKAQRLIEKSSTVYAAVREELLAFANFLEQHASQKD